MIQTVMCRNCKRTAEIYKYGDGHPYGWYSVSVNVPPEVGHHAKPYRWIGLFCSVGCLMAHERVLLEDVELMSIVYERE